MSAKVLSNGSTCPELTAQQIHQVAVVVKQRKEERSTGGGDALRVAC